jgi:hypothetical protein
MMIVISCFINQKRVTLFEKITFSSELNALTLALGLSFAAVVIVLELQGV